MSYESNGRHIYCLSDVICENTPIIDPHTALFEGIPHAKNRAQRAIAVDYPRFRLIRSAVENLTSNWKRLINERIKYDGINFSVEEKQVAKAMLISDYLQKEVGYSAYESDGITLDRGNNAPEIFNSYGPLIGMPPEHIRKHNLSFTRGAMCSGLAETFAVLGRAMGLDVQIQSNVVHAWNTVGIGGRHYCVDIAKSIGMDKEKGCPPRMTPTDDYFLFANGKWAYSKAAIKTVENKLYPPNIIEKPKIIIPAPGTAQTPSKRVALNETPETLELDLELIKSMAKEISDNISKKIIDIDKRNRMGITGFMDRFQSEVEKMIIANVNAPDSMESNLGNMIEKKYGTEIAKKMELPLSHTELEILVASREIIESIPGNITKPTFERLV
jgi:hypothetical protein